MTHGIIIENDEFEDWSDIYQDLNDQDKAYLRRKMMGKILENTKKYKEELKEQERLKKLLEKSSEDFWGI